MAGGIDWFRWHHGSVTDPKFQLVARKSKQTLAAIIAVWAFLLERASESDVRGEFGAVDFESIDCLLAWTTVPRNPSLPPWRTVGWLWTAAFVRGKSASRNASAQTAPTPTDLEHSETGNARRCRAAKRNAKKSTRKPKQTMQRHATPRNAKKSLEERRGE